MADENLDATAGRSRRWDDMPSTMEWRVLHLEKENDDKEVRMRRIESEHQELRAMMNDVRDQVHTVQEDVRSSVRAGSRNSFLIIIAIVAAVLPFLLRGAHP